MDCLKGIEIPSYTLLKEKRREPILEKDEYLRLKEYWTKKNPYYWLIISFVNSTGIRYPSELLKIQWKHVHLDKSYLWIVNRKSKDKTQPLDTPIPLVGRTREIIETLKNRPNISTEPEDFVFVNDKGKVIKNIRKSFNKSLEECGIDSNICMYSLRHLFTTRMVRRADIPVKVLSTVLGHKDTTMVDRQYSHLKTEHIVSVFQRSEDKKQETLNGQRQSQSENNHKTP